MPDLRWVSAAAWVLRHNVRPAARSTRMVDMAVLGCCVSGAGCLVAGERGNLKAFSLHAYEGASALLVESLAKMVHLVQKREREN